MSFFNDECDLADDDQYDLFTSTSLIHRDFEKPGTGHSLEVNAPGDGSGSSNRKSRQH